MALFTLVLSLFSVLMLASAQEVNVTTENNAIADIIGFIDNYSQQNSPINNVSMHYTDIAIIYFQNGICCHINCYLEHQISFAFNNAVMLCRSIHAAIGKCTIIHYSSLLHVHSQSNAYVSMLTFKK